MPPQPHMQSLEHGAHVLEWQFNRPEKRNALNWDTLLEFEKAVAQLKKKKQVRVLMLSGAGESFCAGGDFDFLLENTRLPAAKVAQRMERFYRGFLALRSLPQSTIALVNGSAVGAGLCLALACDQRFVLAGARLSLNFVKIGLSPGMGAWPLARALIGEHRARELILNAVTFTGRELAAWGAAEANANTVGELRAQALERAHALAALDPLAQSLAKQEMQLSDRELLAHLKFEARAQAQCFRNPDFRSRLQAAAKRL